MRCVSDQAAAAPWSGSALEPKCCAPQPRRCGAVRSVHPTVHGAAHRPLRTALARRAGVGQSCALPVVDRRCRCGVRRPEATFVGLSSCSSRRSRCLCCGRCSTRSGKMDQRRGWPLEPRPEDITRTQRHGLHGTSQRRTRGLPPTARHQHRHFHRRVPSPSLSDRVVSRDAACVAAGVGGAGRAAAAVAGAVGACDPYQDQRADAVVAGRVAAAANRPLHRPDAGERELRPAVP